MFKVSAGNDFRHDATFSPVVGNTTLAQVTAKVCDPDGVATDLTPVETATNSYYAWVTIPEDAKLGAWVVRWKCASPKISKRDPFEVVA